MANTLSTDKKIAIIGSLAEGSSIRSIERITGVHRDTIMRLGVKVGQGCTALLDETMRNHRARWMKFGALSERKTGTCVWTTILAWAAFGHSALSTLIQSWSRPSRLGSARLLGWMWTSRLM